MASANSSCVFRFSIVHAAQLKEINLPVSVNSVNHEILPTCKISAQKSRDVQSTYFPSPMVSESAKSLVSAAMAAVGGFLLTSLPARAVDGEFSVDAVDPLVLAAGLGAVAIPGTLFLVFGRKGYTGDLKAEDALKLLEEESVTLVDIRSGSDRKEAGSPSLKSVKKKVLVVEFEQEEEDGSFSVDPEFASSVSSSKAVTPDSTIIVIDKLGGIAPNAAKVLSKSGFKTVFVVKGGAEGTGGWKESGLPWVKPGPSFKLDMSTLRQAISSSVEESKALVPASLGVAAAAGASIVLLSEVEAAMQLLGTAALVQLTLKKFLFAEDRKKTIAEIKAFLDTKVAPKDLVEDIKEIGASLLPESQAAKQVELVADVVAEAIGEREQEGEEEARSEVMENGASSEPIVSKPTPSSIDLPPPPRPLSPYAIYPDLKPPASPTPSPP